MAKKSSDEYLASILNLLDGVIDENKKAAKNAGVSNVPNTAVFSADAASIKNLGDSLKILSSAIQPLEKISEDKINTIVKNIKAIGQAIRDFGLDKETMAAISNMISAFVQIHTVMTTLTDSFWKSMIKFNPLKGRLLGRQLGKFYGNVLKGMSKGFVKNMVSLFKEIPSSKEDPDFKTRIVNFGLMTAALLAITKEKIMQLWFMGVMLGEKIGNAIGKFFKAIVNNIAGQGEKDVERANAAAKVAISVSAMIGVLTLSLVALVLLFKTNKWEDLVGGSAMLIGVVALSFGIIKILGSDKFKGKANAGLKGTKDILMLIGGLTLALALLILIAKSFSAGQIIAGSVMLIGVVALSLGIMYALGSDKFSKSAKKGIQGVGSIIMLFVGMSLAMFINILVAKHAKDIIIGGGITMVFTALSILLFKLLTKGLTKKTVINGLIGVAGIVLMIAGVSLAMLIYAEYLKKIGNIPLEGVLSGVAITAAMIVGMIGLAHIMSPLAFDPFFWIGVGMVGTIALLIGSISYAMGLFADFVAKISQLKDEDFKNAIDRIAGNPGMVSTLKTIMGALSSFGFKAVIKMRVIGSTLKPIFESLSMFVDIIQKMAKMEILDHYDSNGKPVYRKMTNEEFSQAGQTVTDAFTYFLTTLSKGLEQISDAEALRKVIDALFPPTSGGFLSFFKKTKRKGIGDIIPCISQFVDVIVKFASMTVPTEWNSEGVAIKYRRIENKEFIEAAKTVTDSFVTFLTTLSTGLNQISNAAYLQDIINHLFPPPKVYGLFSKRVVEQPGIGVVIQALSSFTDVIIKMATSQIPDEWSKDGTPIHYRKLENREFILAAILTTKCFTLFLQQLSDDLTKMSPLSLFALKLLSDTGISDVMGSLGAMMDPIFQLAAGKIQIGNEVVTIDKTMLAEATKNIVIPLITMLTALRSTFSQENVNNENAWSQAKGGTESGSFVMENFSNMLQKLFQKTDKTLLIEMSTKERRMTVYQTLALFEKIRDTFNKGDWGTGKSNSDKAFYMIQDFSQALAMLFNETGFVKGNASEGKQYIQINKVTPIHIATLKRVSNLAFGLAKYINEHEFNTQKAKNFSEQMNYVNKGIKTIQPLLNVAPMQMFNIAKSLRALDVELIDKQKQRTEAIQSVSNNFKDMSENIQKLNDTLAQSMNLMNNYNKMRMFSSNMLQQRGAEAIVNATEQVKNTVQSAVENTKYLSNLESKEEKRKENMQQFAEVVSQAIATALSNWSSQNKELIVKFDESPKAIFGNVEMG